MPKRSADELSQSSSTQAVSEQAYRAGSTAPRNSMSEEKKDGPQIETQDTSNPNTAQEDEAEDIAMEDADDEEQQIGAFESALSSKLEAVGDGDLGGKEKAEANNGKEEDVEHQRKKKRTQAEEGAGSGRYENVYS